MGDTKKQVPNRACDQFFRPQREDESKDEYARSWMAAINKNHTDFRNINQPRLAERLQWTQKVKPAWELRPGEMISDEMQNQTWRRIASVHLKGTASAWGEQEYDVIVVLCEFTGSLCMDDCEAVQTLVPESVSTFTPRMQSR